MRVKSKLVVLVILALVSVVVLYFYVFSLGSQNPKSTNIAKPSPSSNTTPGVNISKGKSPDIPLTLPPGYVIHVFAQGLGNPRVLVFSPGGTLLVSNPGGNNVYALPDSNNDGVADEAKIIISGESRVHGLIFYQGDLYIADVDRVVRYKWNEASLTAVRDKTLFSLPSNSDHNNRSLTFDNKGEMYVSVGSTCNVCSESPQTGGSVWASDSEGIDPHVFAEGLRNAAFLVINPETEELWATGMGRDYLGDNLPPDEINIIRDGGNYGWPYCYGDRVHDDNFDPENTRTCENTIAPIYEIPAHSAPLGLRFISSSQFPADWQGDLLVSYHGSWNRSTPSGYKVVHLKVLGNTIVGSEDFISGFVPVSIPDIAGNYINDAISRPVDLVFDKRGNLYLSDDKGGNVFIIQKE